MIFDELVSLFPYLTLTNFMDKNLSMSKSYARHKHNEEGLSYIIGIPSAIQGLRSGTYITEEDTDMSDASPGSARSCDIDDGSKSM